MPAALLFAPEIVIIMLLDLQPDQHELSASSALHEPDSATASAFLLTSLPQITSSHQSDSRSLLQSGTAAADTNASLAASESTSNAVQSASASTGTSVTTATHIHTDSQAQAHPDKPEGARDTMSGSQLQLASVSTAAGRSQLSANLPRDSMAQLDLDLPAQLAEPESQEAGPAVASDVVRGRMARSVACMRLFCSCF